jgi:hypothetical protein
MGDFHKLWTFQDYTPPPDPHEPWRYAQGEGPSPQDIPGGFESAAAPAARRTCPCRG